MIKLPYINNSLRFITGLALILTAPTIALATQYNTVVPDESNVQFVYTQMGVSMEGSFKEFEGEIEFDTDNPESASASFQVSLSSVDTGTTDGDEEVVKDEWFAVNNHPFASFTSEKVAVGSNNSYEVEGVLNIKGQEKSIVIPVQLSESENKAVFEGEFNINRGDFAIGEGSWSSFDIVANEVTVKVKITATSN